MYEMSSVIIALVLLIFLMLALEIGYRLGLRSQLILNESIKTQVGAIQASLLGILALLLGFTFSISLQHYGSRSEAVVNEANAIGTAILRAQLLPSTVREEAQNLMDKYLNLRIQAGKISLDKNTKRDPLLVKSQQNFDALWGYARRAAHEDGGPVTSGLFIQSLNEVIDSFGRRDAELNRQVPEIVLLLLFITYIMTGAMVGYGSGLAGHRASFATYILVALIVVVVFIVIDLDRPRRGFIEVSQESLTNLQNTTEATKKLTPNKSLLPGP